MTIMEAIENRHSVRAYKDIPIETDVREQLNHFTDKCNEESGLHIILRRQPAKK